MWQEMELDLRSDNFGHMKHRKCPGMVQQFQDFFAVPIADLPFDTVILAVFFDSGIDEVMSIIEVFSDVCFCQSEGILVNMGMFLLTEFPNKVSWPFVFHSQLTALFWGSSLRRSKMQIFKSLNASSKM